MTEIKITEPVLLIRTSRLFKEGMTAVELYEITQGVWILGPDREKATYAFCIANMIVQEIYSIHYWQEAGTKTYTTSAQQAANIKDGRWDGRWEFIGEVAPTAIRNKYIGKSVAHYYKKGNACSVMYLNVKVKKPSS